MLNKLTAVSQKISPNLRRVIGNTGWLFTEKIAQMILGLLVGLWIARYLGPEQFGRFNYALAIVGLFLPFGKLGLDNIVIRNLARNSAEKDEALGTAFILKFIGSSLTFLATLGFVILSTSERSINPTETFLLVGILASGTIVQSFEIIDYWFQSQVLSKYSVIARLAAYIFMNGVKLILIQLRAPLIAFAIAMVAEYILAAISYLIAYRFNGNLIKTWQFSIGYAKSLLKDSWPLILSGVVIMIYMRIDQFMLGQMIGDKSVGVYSAAVKISELWYFVPGAIVNSVFPYIVRAKQVNEEVYYQRLQQLLTAVSILAYSVAIPVTFLSTQIVTLLYGKNYAEAGAILNIHIWAGLFVSLGLARETWITTEGLMKFSAATSAIGAVINIILNLFLIPKYGGLGAAIATVIAQFLAAYGIGAIYPPTRRIFIHQTKAISLLGLFDR